MVPIRNKMLKAGSLKHERTTSSPALSNYNSNLDIEYFHLDAIVSEIHKGLQDEAEGRVLTFSGAATLLDHVMSDDDGGLYGSGRTKTSDTHR